MPTKRLPLIGTDTETPLEPLSRGMPSLDSIIDVVPFAPSPHGPPYLILKTTEIDAYDATKPALALRKLLQGKGPRSRAAVEAALKTQAPAGDDFAGTARKAAKLSIPNAATENFTDLKNLIDALTPDDAMIAHHPPIKTTPTSTRVKEEKRNIHVTAFLYAASLESDNDYHLIIGRDPTATPEMYVTIEVSGLPSKTSASFAKLKAARDSYKSFFGTHLPGTNYHFYQPPVPVSLDGALFFDMSHASGTHPGPASLKSRMPTIWEVHPVTAITLGP